MEVYSDFGPVYLLFIQSGRYVCKTITYTETTIYWCGVYLHRAVFWENFSVWCLWSSKDPFFSRKPSNPLTFLRYQLTTRLLQSMLTHSLSHTHTLYIHKPPLKPTINQQVHGFSCHFYSQFIQPTFRCFLNSAHFYSASCRSLTYACTHTHRISAGFL